VADRLKGKVALITGAGMGMGREASVLFAEQGARVVVADIDGKAAQETVALSEGGRAGGWRSPATWRSKPTSSAWSTRGAALRRAARPLQQRRRAVEGPRPSVLETDDKWWDRVMAINLKSVFWVTKYGIPHLRAAGGGSIIMMGSVSALAGFTRAQDAYTSAKGALISLTKSLAIQFAKDQIRCNVIHPGIVDTPLQAPYLTDAIRKEFEDRHPARPHRAAARDRERRALPRQ
jgi:NAD(P)-dependent dehydrogenase (short-subunit alcohol dehydrogenase family)